LTLGKKSSSTHRTVDWGYQERKGGDCHLKLLEERGKRTELFFKVRSSRTFQCGKKRKYASLPFDIENIFRGNLGDVIYKI